MGCVSIVTISVVEVIVVAIDRASELGSGRVSDVGAVVNLCKLNAILCEYWKMQLSRNSNVKHTKLNAENVYGNGPAVGKHQIMSSSYRKLFI